jgi:hypothetical protein
MIARLVLLLLPLAAWADIPQATVTPPPGRYSAAVTVDVTVPEGTSVFYRFAETASPRSLPWAGPLTLDSMPGETRIYTLRLTTQLPTGESVVKDFSYTVTRTPSLFPTVKPVPGTYDHRIELHPSLPAGWTLTEDGLPVSALELDTAAGSQRTYVFEARGQGQSAVWTYGIDKRDQDAAIDVLSPIPGNWANVQPLVLSFRGLDRVVWSYGDHIDGAGTEYTGPITLESGTRTVTVAGHTRNGQWIERHATWTSGVADPPAGWPMSGVRTEAADFAAVDGWTFSWDEGRSWQTSARHEDVPAFSRKIVTVQAKNGAAVSRFLYWFDIRTPQQPQLRFEGGWNPRVYFSGAADAIYRVAWTTSDGAAKDDAAVWGPLGSWKVPDGAVGVKVTASAANGTTAVASLTFGETGWSVPRWETWNQTAGPKLPAGGKVVPRPGFLAAYEVSSSPEVPEPGAASPWLDGAFLPTVPWGADRTFYVRFAWRDAAGLTGPASGVYAVRVDRMPPPLPSVRESAGQITVSTDDDASLFWAVTPERVQNADAVVFQPYHGPIDRSSLGASGLWFHARAQDSVGNVGAPRLNVALAGTPTGVVQVDSDPSVGETPVSDGGVYPWSELRLRNETSGLWVGTADASTGIPPDWSNELQPWNGIFLHRSDAPRRSILVYWNLKTNDGWAWPQPKTLTLTLDRGSAAAPELPVWPSAPLSRPWTLAMKPGQAGDTLKYSFTTDGSTPVDPAAAGQIWPGSRTWEAPEGIVTTLNLRLAAISVSGAATEIPLTPIQFDRRLGRLAVVPLESFTYKNAPLTVPGVPGTIRYTLTTDGSTPSVPGPDSPVVADGLTLSGTEGQTVLYRFRWRQYTDAGEPGPATDVYSVLIDRTLSTPLVDKTAPGPAPRVSGIPESGISAAPVTVQADWSGELRYELQEGVGIPPAVTSGSPLWSQPLKLGSDGIDRTYTLKLRGFSPTGQPLTDEFQYIVRVDLAIPGPPVFEVAAGARAEATLSSSNETPDEALEYRWVWKSYPEGHGESSWTTWTSPVVFSAPGGEMTSLTVQARLRDEAGNVGPIAEKAVFLDQNVVYVAPGASGDGSRGAPVGTIGGAVDAARRTGRGVLFVAVGNYAIDTTLDLGGLKVYGGWAKEQWETSVPTRAVWTQAEGFHGPSLIRTNAADWSLTGVDLFAAKGLGQVVAVQGGAVSIQDSSWTWGAAGQGWSQTGGSLALSHVSAIYHAQAHGLFLSLDSVSATLDGMNLAADGNQEGLLIACRGAAVKVSDLVVVSKDGTGYDAVWQSEGGRLSVTGARILAGDGAGRSLAFRLKDAEASLTRLDLSLFGSASNTAFQLTGGTLNLSQSSMSLLRGTEFNQAVVADHAGITLDGFGIKIDSGSYQGGFNLDGGSLALSSGSVSLAGGGLQAWGGRFRGASLVTVDGVNWTLGQKTPGQVWLLDTPWTTGSAVTRSPATGW